MALSRPLIPSDQALGLRRSEKDSITPHHRPLSEADARLKQAPLGTGAGYPGYTTARKSTAWYGTPREMYGEPVMTRNEKIMIVGLVLVAAAVRLWHIWSPTSVV